MAAPYKIMVDRKGKLMNITHKGLRYERPIGIR